MKAVLRSVLTLAATFLAISSARALPVCAPMDFNGDCKSDILWRSSATGEDRLWLMNGLTIAAQGDLTTVDDPAWQVHGIGDFDGDGRADLLWRNALTGENYIWLMNGLTSTERGLVNFIQDPAWQVQGVGDFDGDGRADILWRNTSTGENYIYLMNGWTIAARGLVNFVQDPAWQVKGIGDFDGDGRADILWRHAATGENYLYLMNGWTIAARGLVNFVPPNSGWQLKAIGDFDGDGRADILWRHAATGENYVYLMTGWTMAAREFLDTTADLSWMPRSATTMADTVGPDRIAPATPTGLTASAVSTSRINLSWSAATDNVGVIRYGVYRNGVQIASVYGTSYSSTGLSAGTTYRYTITAHDAARNASAQSSAVSAATKAVPDTQNPSTPANLAASVVSASQIDLLWSAATDNVGVTGYRVYRDGALVASPSGTSVSLTGLSASTLYSFAVLAVDAAGNASAPSAPLAVTTPPPPDSIAPSTPTGVIASAVTATSLILSWNAASDNVAVTGYRVYRDAMLVASPGGTSLSIAGLSPSTLYSFTVSAVDAAGNASAPSAPLSLTTLASQPDATAPSTPAGLAAFALTPTSVSLSWSAATDNVGVTGYRLYRDGTLVASPTGISASITGLLPSTLYTFAVSAVDAAGNASALSAPLAVTTPAPPDTTAPTTPTSVAASALTSTSLTLAWNAATDNVAVIGYRVYRGGTLVASPGGTSVSITGLLAGALYSFTVSAVDAAGNASAPSAPLSVTTLVLPPPPPPPPAPQVLWSAGMETGSLSEWDWEENSGSADSVAVTAASAGIPAKSGNWVMRQAVTGSSGGTRMIRYPEINALSAAGTTFYVSWWDYFPTRITFGSSDMFAFWQIASRDSQGGYHPIWNLHFHGSNGTLMLVWSPNNMAPAGPHAGESGGRVYSSTRAAPIGQWVFFEVMIKPAADFTGAVKVWMNGDVLFDQVNVKTRFPDVGVGGWMGSQHLAYGSGLTPTPAIHYVDDLTVSLGRMPYAP